MVHALREFQKTLNIEEVVAEFKENGFGTQCKHWWDQDGWLVEFVPIPKAEEYRGRPESRPLGGFHMPSPVIVSNDDNIRASVKFKLKHHPHLDKPYVIAVAVPDQFGEEEDFMNAIYGTMSFQLNTITGESRSARQNNGVWSGGSGPRNDHLVAVIGAWRLFTYSVPRAEVVVFENPYIDPVEEIKAIDFPHWVRCAEKLERRTGRTTGEIHRLDPGWPSFDQRG